MPWVFLPGPRVSPSSQPRGEVSGLLWWPDDTGETDGDSGSRSARAALCVCTNAPEKGRDGGIVSVLSGEYPPADNAGERWRSERARATDQGHTGQGTSRLRIPGGAAAAALGW